MPPSLHLVQSDVYALLVSLLRDADEDEQRIQALLTDGDHTSYLVYADISEGAQPIGAVSMRWSSPTSEIEYIAIATELRGHGYGKALIALILQEATSRGITAVLVGTANSSLATIAFYQKCGFRMHHVRPDFFSYIHPPLYEDGIMLRDMLVLRWDAEQT
jgi:ribosomal protein S18 acetylase RimI-like enzyme